MKTTGFSFAGLNGLILSENKVKITKNFQPFLRNYQISDYVIEYVSCAKLTDLYGEFLYTGIEYDVIQKENGDIIRIFKDAKKAGFVYAYSRMLPFEEHVKIFYLKGNEEYFDDTNNSFFHSGWEQILLWKKRMILHASLIDTAYGGILFSGVSGAGKTTQAELWMKWEQARQINGDRPILYKSDKGWLGGGSPYAGSSECYINECIPIKTIILLEQGTQTSLQRVSITEAVKRIYANSTVYTWNKEYVEKLLNLIMILVQEIPVYRLINRADHDSVEIVKKELQKEVI